MAQAWRAVCVLQGALLLLNSLCPTGVYSDYDGVDQTYQVIAGHAMRLNCSDVEEPNWRRKGGPALHTLAGVEVRDRALWFLPAQAEHSGVYVCSGIFNYSIRLTVSNGSCPEAVERNDFDWNLNIYKKVDCKDLMSHISSVISPTSVSCLKECKPLEKADSSGVVTFNKLQQTDGGTYTCVLRFTLEGRNYTSALSFRVIVYAPIRLLQPEIIIPTNNTQEVDLGSRQEIRCEAVNASVIRWKKNDTFIHSKDPDFNISEEENSVGKRVSILTIFKVQPKFLNIPFVCTAQNLRGAVSSTVVLIQVNHKHWMAVVASLCGLVVMCLLLCWFFKVDLVLFYRSHCRGSDRYDGKHYDAYVCYPCEGQGVTMAMNFVLGDLSEVLEEKHGYKLFIRGRDDCPGEELCEVIEDALRKSRRFIIVLDATQDDMHDRTVANPAITHQETETHTHTAVDTHITSTGSESPMLPSTRTQPLAQAQAFEQSLGVHEALVCSGPKLVVIQTGQGDGKSSLPPALGLLTSHSQRVLRWHTHMPTHSRRRFWKELRYLMPVAQKSSHSTSLRTQASSTRGRHP